MKVALIAVRLSFYIHQVTQKEPLVTTSSVMKYVKSTMKEMREFVVLSDLELS